MQWKDLRVKEMGPLQGRDARPGAGLTAQPTGRVGSGLELCLELHRPRKAAWPPSPPRWRPPAAPGRSSGRAGHGGRTVPSCLSLLVGILMLRICACGKSPLTGSPPPSAWEELRQRALNRQSQCHEQSQIRSREQSSLPFHSCLSVFNVPNSQLS